MYHTVQAGDDLLRIVLERKILDILLCYLATEKFDQRVLLVLLALLGGTDFKKLQLEETVPFLVVLYEFLVQRHGKNAPMHLPKPRRVSSSHQGVQMSLDANFRHLLLMDSRPVRKRCSDEISEASHGKRFANPVILVDITNDSFPLEMVFFYPFKHAATTTTIDKTP